jgi:hypothetical protein
MPGYAGAGKAQILRNNTQGTLWSIQDGSPAASTLTIAFLLERINRSYYPWGLSFEVTFSGNPSTFEIDIMGADTDVAANYLELGSITTASGSTVSGAYVGRYDMASNLWPKYVAAYIKTLTNAVNMTLVVQK